MLGWGKLGPIVWILHKKVGLVVDNWGKSMIFAVSNFKCYDKY